VEDFLDQYGYFALMVGTFFEGETAILVAASLVYQGIFEIPPTVFFGFAGSFVSDWVYYLIGKVNGRYFLARRPSLLEKMGRVQKFLDKNEVQVLLTYRFLYGFRIIIPLIIGMSRIRPGRFLLFSIISGLTWAFFLSILGYLTGRFFKIESSVFEDNLLIIIPSFALLGLLIGYVIKKITFKEIVNDPN
jgi:membrane protein DedA with SNARE-associated domain